MLRERDGGSSGSLNDSATQELAASNKINETGSCIVARGVISHLRKIVAYRCWYLSQARIAMLCSQCASACQEIRTGLA